MDFIRHLICGTVQGDVSFKNVKCIGCCEIGHILKNCNHQHGKELTKIFESRCRDVLRSRFKSIDNILPTNINSLFVNNREVRDLRNDLLNLNIYELRMINSKNNRVFGKKKSRLVALFLFSEITRILFDITINKYNVNSTTHELIRREWQYLDKLVCGINEESAFEEYISGIRMIFGNHKYPIQVAYSNNISNIPCVATIDQFECAICLDTYRVKDNAVITNCGHVFCSGCITTYLKNISKIYKKNVDACCAICREKYVKLTVDNNKLQKELACICI